MDSKKGYEYYKQKLDEWEKNFDEAWISIDSRFSDKELVSKWGKFCSQEVKWWIEAGLTVQDYGFCTWLGDVKKIKFWEFSKISESEKAKLKTEYQEQQLESKAEIPYR